MPEKSHTLAYAAGASLAAITLVYVFAPTFFLDGENGSSALRKPGGIVGLVNPANDCFINSVLQALAGLGDLRMYLIRETHRRKLDGPDVYSRVTVDSDRMLSPAWKVQGLQGGLVTQGLKTILDALNERPLYKKTISAAGFVAVLEHAFKQRISRQQQDAQEFLQVVAERLCDEYHAGRRARRLAGLSSESPAMPSSSTNERGPRDAHEDQSPQANSVERMEMLESPCTAVAGSDEPYTDEEEEGFPLEGASESQIECLTCGFKPRPTKTTFCTLTLSVPQVNSTSLHKCFDSMFFTEYIVDFKCDKCRLLHAIEMWSQEMRQSTSQSFQTRTQDAIRRIQEAIDTDPEHPPREVDLPDIKLAPKGRIAKHVRITRFPKVMAIHLSRSIFDAGRSTLKNSAKVSFPGRLRLGGLLNQHKYKLVSVVCHKGSHHSGHYESFRRQSTCPPYSTHDTFKRSKVYTNGVTSDSFSPQLATVTKQGDTNAMYSDLELLSPQSVSSASLANTTSRVSPESTQITIPSSPNVETGSLRSIARSAKSSMSSKVSSLRRYPKSTLPAPEAEESHSNELSMSEKEDSHISLSRKQQKKKKWDQAWIRISDDKSKQTCLKDVLGMEKEVYLLFYELKQSAGRGL